MARPTKLTDATRAKLVKALGAGNYRDTAAELAGIGTSTLYRWLEQGEADHEHNVASAHRELWDALKKAEAEAEAKALAQIQSAAGETWQSAAWFLEHKYPAKYARRDAMKIEHSGGIKQEVTVDIPDDDQRRQEVAALLERQGALNGHT